LSKSQAAGRKTKKTPIHDLAFGEIPIPISQSNDLPFSVAPNEVAVLHQLFQASAFGFGEVVVDLNFVVFGEVWRGRRTTWDSVG
jgi:hypothetical protein